MDKSQPQGVKFSELSEGDQNLATLAIGVDTLLGGNIGSRNGADHWLLDTWTSGIDFPQIYYDGLADALRKNNGASPQVVEIAKTFVQIFKLHELSGLLRDTARTYADSGYLLHQVDAFDVILRTTEAVANQTQLPEFAERYRKGTGLGYVHFIDNTTAHAGHLMLEAALNDAGYPVTASRNITEAVKAWTAERSLQPEMVKPVADEISQWLLAETRRNILNGGINPLPGHKPDLSDIAFDGSVFATVTGQRFTGSSAYHGGTHQDGSPKLESLTEYNTDHPMSKGGLVHLMSHEMFPGHYLDSAITDLAWREGKLGFEATIPTMCTPANTLREGLAENALQLALWADSMEQVFGIVEAKYGRQAAMDFKVALALNHLQNIGKNNVSIMHQAFGVPLEDVARYVREELAQPEPIVNKLTGAWSKHPVWGPMYGGTYYWGKDIVGNAIQRYGRQAVTRLGFPTDGLVDGNTFQQKLKNV